MAADTARTFGGPAARHSLSTTGGRVRAICGCGRNVRIVSSVLARVPIVCDGYGKVFLVEDMAS